MWQSLNNRWGVGNFKPMGQDRYPCTIPGCCMRTMRRTFFQSGASFQSGGGFFRRQKRQRPLPAQNTANVETAGIWRQNRPSIPRHRAALAGKKRLQLETPRGWGGACAVLRPLILRFADRRGPAEVRVRIHGAAGPCSQSPRPGRYGCEPRQQGSKCAGGGATGFARFYVQDTILAVGTGIWDLGDLNRWEKGTLTVWRLAG